MLLCLLCRSFLVTAKGDSKDVVAGLEAGGDEYLTKPVDHAALVARVKSMLRMPALENRIAVHLERGARGNIDYAVGLESQGRVHVVDAGPPVAPTLTVAPSASPTIIREPLIVGTALWLSMLSTPSIRQATGVLTVKSLLLMLIVLS